MKKDLKTFLIEIVTIIVGILVALFINDWNDNRKDQAYMDKTLSSIKKELTETNEEISEILPQQNSLVDTLDFYLKDNKISLFNIAEKANGYKIATIRINSWKAISNSKIELMEYDEVSALAKIEGLNELIILKAQKMADLFYVNANDTGEDTKKNMKVIMMDIIWTEEESQRHIKEFIKE